MTLDKIRSLIKVNLEGAIGPYCVAIAPDGVLVLTVDECNAEGETIALRRYEISVAEVSA